MTSRDSVAQPSLRRIVAEHLAAQEKPSPGPLPPLDRQITLAYECGRPIPEIAIAHEVTVRQVMDALCLDYFCSVCGRAADFHSGHVAYAADGDRDVPYWATPDNHDLHCSGEGLYIGRNGHEYSGPGPMGEEEI